MAIRLLDFLRYLGKSLLRGLQGFANGFNRCSRGKVSFKRRALRCVWPDGWAGAKIPDEFAVGVQGIAAVGDDPQRDDGEKSQQPFWPLARPLVGRWETL